MCRRHLLTCRLHLRQVAQHLQLTRTGRCCRGEQSRLRHVPVTRCAAVPNSRPARSRAAFMEMPAMLPVSPAQRPSNNPVATERAIDALLPISGAALGSAAFGCAVRKTSSRLLRPLRTYPSRQVRCPTAATTAHGVRCVSGICVVRIRRRRSSCERLGKPATAQWFSRPAWHSRSPTYATNCRKQPWTVQPR